MSDPMARKRIDNYIAQRKGRRGLDPDLIHAFDIGCATEAELNVSGIELVLEEADRDRRFAEAVRELCDAKRDSYYISDQLIGWRHLDKLHDGIYGTPCTKEQS